jgi:hypothetical protein
VLPVRYFQIGWIVSLFRGGVMENLGLAVTAVVAGIVVVVVLTVVGILRSRKVQADFMSRHPGATLIGGFIPLQPLRDAVAAIVTAQGRSAVTPRYRTQRGAILVQNGVLSLRLPLDDELVVEISADDITGIERGELKVGMNRFPTADVTVTVGGAEHTLPIAFTKPTDAMQKPTDVEAAALVANLTTALGR